MLKTYVILNAQSVLILVMLDNSENKQEFIMNALEPRAPHLFEGSNHAKQERLAISKHARSGVHGKHFIRLIII